MRILLILGIPVLAALAAAALCAGSAGAAEIDVDVVAPAGFPSKSTKVKFAFLRCGPRGDQSEQRCGERDSYAVCDHRAQSAAPLLSGGPIAGRPSSKLIVLSAIP